MNLLTLLDDIVQLIATIGPMLSSLGDEAQVVWTDLLSVYETIKNAILNFTSPSDAEMQAAQDTLSKAKALVAGAKKE